MAGVSSIWDIPSVRDEQNAGVQQGAEYSSTGQVRRSSVWSHGLYHEQQEGAMCAVHAINNMLQDRVVTEIGLAQIGQQLDAAERAAGATVVGEASNNVRADGFFGIQVIQNALTDMGLQMTPLGYTDDGRAASNPAEQTAYILNRHEHW
jgi:ataxin-3